MLDAGVLVSVDRGEQAARSFQTAAERAGQELHTHPVTTRDPGRDVWASGLTPGRAIQIGHTQMGETPSHWHYEPPETGPPHGQRIVVEN